MKLILRPGYNVDLVVAVVGRGERWRELDSGEN